jgi:Na+-transporting methylmalonyl-CoA/oxaloacetate decarboxylase gamma subunit
MFKFENISAGNGYEISLTGMAIVFSGLLLISLFIILLPRLLALLDRLTAKGTPTTAVTATTPSPPTEEEIMAAISLAIHIELERCGGDLQRITMAKRPSSGSFWHTAGKMRSLSNRSPYA